MKSLKTPSKLIVSIVACMFILQANAQDPKAENMLLFQRSSGGWFKQFNHKQVDYNVEFSAADKQIIADEVNNKDATIDNNATTTEITYLLKAYKKFNNPKYLAAAEKGISYLLEAQYANGGWPQYYPDKSFYRGEITYNDNAMIHALNLLQDIVLKKNDFDIVNPSFVEPSTKAISKGIDCILKTQIKVNGKLTAWCQQYDETTLQPAKARAYELPSITAQESVYIVEFLMSQPNPSREIRDAINAAVQWFHSSKIVGYKVDVIPAPNTPKGRDIQLVTDSTSTIWARYYEIDTNKPFFCGRNGIKVYSVQDIEYERRNGYAWYGNWPQRLLDQKYPEWIKNNGEK
jgi:PelA/Pel-15E family pectate lyase